MKLFKYLLPLFIATNCFAQSLPIRNDTPTALRDLKSNLNVGKNFAVNQYGQVQVVLVPGDSGAASAIHIESAQSANGDAGVGMLGVQNTNIASALTAGSLQWGFLSLDVTGAANSIPFGTGSGKAIGRTEDDVWTSGDVGVMSMSERDDTLTSGTSGNHDLMALKSDAQGALFIHEALPGAPTSTTPTVTNTTSFTCLAANTTRKWFLVQNNSGANIMISLSNATLTGIVPTSTNIGIVLTPGSSYTSSPNYVSTSAITCYQSSGGSINTIVVIEG